MKAKLVTKLHKPIKFDIEVPGSKSHMNRVLICAVLAKGKTIIQNPVYCDDSNYLIKALQKLGVRILKKPNSLWVYGSNQLFLKKPKEIFLGNAGTATRFLTPLVPEQTTIVGDKYMQQRPLSDLILALQQLGYDITCLTKCPPITINTKQQLFNNITVKGDMSSQYLSALLMLAPTLKQGLIINVKGRLVSKPYVDLTIAVMKHFGVKVNNQNYRKFKIASQLYKSNNINIAGDASSATYWWTLAAISKSKINVINVKPDQQADYQYLKVLKKVGCKVENTSVTGPQLPLKAITVDMKSMPDAVMSLAMIAAIANGKTIIKNIGHLAIKETNRLSLLVNNLKRLGIKASHTNNSLTIIGNEAKLLQRIKPVIIETKDDHRIVMCFTVLGMQYGNIKIDNPDCVKKSYLSFWKTYQVIQKQSKKQIIVITGMRGSGKSTFGKQLANQYNAKFIDTDNLIEKQTGKTITEIVQQHDWKHFRKLETKVLKQVLKKYKSNVILATGGGILLSDINRKLLELHYQVFLFGPLQTLRQRIMLDEATGYKRPALKSSTVKELGVIWKQRKKVYINSADQIYDIRYLKKT